MAQTGYTTVQLYRTTTASATPTAGNLTDGELAINTTDEKLYFKNASGTVKLLAANVTPVANGGTGATTASTALTNLGAVAKAGDTMTGVLAFTAGTVSAPGITFSGDTNTGIFSPAADTIAFTEGGVESMRIDSSGNVGIGTSSPGARLDVVTSAGAGAGLRVRTPSGDGSPGIIQFTNNAVSAQWGYISSPTSNVLAFGGNSEYARFDSSGNLLVGTTSTLFASSHAFVNSGAAVLGLRNSLSTAGKYWQVGPDLNSSFKVYNQSSVGMFLSDGSTSWSSSSDERQKNIIEPISDATNKVASLRAVIGSYKSDETNKRRSFLIAQDVQQVLPEAVTEAPDGFLGVAYSDVIPLLVAAIQELKAEFDAYKAAHP